MDTWASKQGLTKNVKKYWLRGVLNAFTGPFRFADLPAELRVQVYGRLLPDGAKISFAPKGWDYPTNWGQLNQGNRDKLWKLKFDRRVQEGSDDGRPGAPFFHAGLSIFAVNRLISDEARGESSSLLFAREAR
jgi:hypothetical protein